MNLKDRPIIILSTGRAGSTLLQKLLNTHHEMVIWGEHAGILNQLMNMSKVVSTIEWIPEKEPKGNWLLQKNRPLNEKRWTAWDGSFSKDSFHNHIKKFLDDLFNKEVPENIRWGFKEIRYCNIEVMDFISKIYPHAQFILLLRNPIDSCVSFTTANSSKELKMPSDFSSKLSKIANNQIKPTFQFFKEAIEYYPENNQVVLYEQLVNNPHDVLDEIARFLNLTSGFNEGNISRIMQKDIMSERQRNSIELQKELKKIALSLLKEELAWYRRISSEASSHN